jgi:flagellar biosynthesis protein|tara:strand:- start:2227 stop:2505 length:279 start_codon:yes stop_codon:yes gene_type:complete
LISNSDYEKKVAVALLYDRIKAPTLVAKGEGGLANQILAEAESAGVPVSQDELLANTLAQLSLNEEIPEALFQSVAIVLAWAYRIQGKTPWD